MCVIECHIDQCQRDGGGNDEGQQMGDLEEKEGKKYCGIEKMSYLCTVKRQKDIRVTQVINSKRANKGTPRRD